MQLKGVDFGTKPGEYCNTAESSDCKGETHEKEYTVCNGLSVDNECTRAHEQIAEAGEEADVEHKVHGK